MKKHTIKGILLYANNAIMRMTGNKVHCTIFHTFPSSFKDRIEWAEINDFQPSGKKKNIF